MLKNLYSYEDLQNEEIMKQSLADTIAFYEDLEKDSDGATNKGFQSFDEAIESITLQDTFTQAQANHFFSI